MQTISFIRQCVVSATALNDFPQPGIVVRLSEMRHSVIPLVETAHWYKLSNSAYIYHGMLWSATSFQHLFGLEPQEAMGLIGQHMWLVDSEEMLLGSLSGSIIFGYNFK